MSSGLVRITLREVEQRCVATLGASGLFEASVSATARRIVAAERDRCQSHGLFRLPGFCNALRSGKACGTSVPEVVDAAAGVVRVEARGGLSPLALEVGIPAVAAKARSQGVAALCVKDAFHFSALWHEVEALADGGLVGLAFLNTKGFVAPHGAASTGAVFGTNPMAFAAPRPGGAPPLLWDQASAAMARGEISLKLQAGEPLPPGVAVDVDGAPTTDPKRARVARRPRSLPFPRGARP